MENDPEEISLRDLFDALWSRRLLIIALTLGFGIAAAVVSLLLPEKYEASVVLSPVDEESGSKLGGAGALLSQFGGLASLGGLNLGGSGKKSVAIATLQSHALTEAFIHDNQLLPVLYADDWDADKKTWTTTDPKETPTLWKAERTFAKKVRSLAEDKKTGLITLTITWTDPELAAKWAGELVQRANEVLRAKAIAESQANLSYLNEQLTKTSVVELQRSIYSLIEAEIKKVMIANGSDEYAFRVVDPARVPEQRVSPKRLLIIAVGVFAGLILGLVLALALPRLSGTRGHR
ncbi:MAG: Wzz/FepE/Etk N-terminal domain-containing protein [Nevskia sp.]|nr:Wzz/FepE/Etk N-terminal domain-containing protein [Nevskia sp.]